MANLSFSDREFLTLYKRFYGTRYPGDTTAPSSENNIGSMTPSHVRGEKLGYILDLCQLSIGGYSYTWNYHGPYSPGLLAQLRELDEKQNEINSFYDQNLPDSVIFSDDRNPQSLFWADDQQRIDKLLDTLDLPKDEGEAGEKMELLGSLAYISLNVIPGAPYDEVIEELIVRKPKYAAEGMKSKIELAWDTFQKLNPFVSDSFCDTRIS